MRLLTKLKRIEAARATAEAEAQAASVGRTPSGLLWDGDAVKLAPELVDALQPGEEVVRDYWILGREEGATLARSRERVTRDVRDRGVVYDAEDRVIGRVVEDDGAGVVVLNYELGAAGAA